jgi:hypothetical protein
LKKEKKLKINGSVKMVDIAEPFEEQEGNISFDIQDCDLTHDILKIFAQIDSVNNEVVIVEVEMTRNDKRKLAKLLLTEWSDK